MPSSFSELKIELMQTGEQSNTWGSVTNQNLGTAIQEAIVGQAAVSFASDADLTLTLTNTPATQPARNFSLRVTSAVSLTATRSLIVPAIHKTYMVINLTTGSQSITIRNSTGTGVTVPNGMASLVYNDGVNIVPMFSYLSAALIDTLLLTNALGVASGGTGAVSLTGLVVGNGTSAMTTVAAPSGTVVGTSDTQTLTNKTINPRVASTTSAGPTATPNGDTTDMYVITAQDQAVAFANISGTPVNGQKMILRLRPDGTTRAVSWSSSSGGYRAVGATLPTSLPASKTTYVGCIYNSSASYWDVVAVSQET